MRFTTEYFENTNNPVHKALFEILTGGAAVGRPIKEENEDDTSDSNQHYPSSIRSS